LYTFAFIDYFPSFASQTVGRWETDQTANLGLDMKFPSKHLTLFAIGTYATTRSIIDSDVLSLNSYANWSFGLLSVAGGAQISRFESRYSSTRTTFGSANYYVTVTRKLF